MKVVKRQISYRACVKCRERKRKCRPSENEANKCVACVTRNLECSFTERGKRGLGKKKKLALRETQQHKNSKVESNLQSSLTDAGDIAFPERKITIINNGLSAYSIKNRSPPIESHENKETQEQDCKISSMTQGKASNCDGLSASDSSYSHVSSTSGGEQYVAAVQILSPQMSNCASSSSGVDQSPSCFNSGFDSVKNYQSLSSLPIRAKLPRPLSTDLLCSRLVFEDMIKTFLNLLYPLTPLIHRPTFVKDLERNREKHDDVWFAMVISLCGFVLANIPRKFLSYRQMDPDLPYKSSKEMFMRCYELVLAIRSSPEWISKQSASLTHFQTVFLISIADHYIEGDHLRAQVGCFEAAAILKCMNIHRWPLGYEGLDNIEIELRKRCLWLVYFKLSMDRFLYDDKEFGLYNAEQILISKPELFIPVELDDEYITSDKMYPQPSGRLPLLSGFVSNIRLHCSIEFPRLTSVEQAIFQEEQDIRKKLQLESARAIVVLNRVKDLAKSFPSELLRWDSGSVESRQLEDQRIGSIESSDTNWYITDKTLWRKQLACQKTNLVVTHLWLQSILLEYSDIKIRQISELSNKKKDSYDKSVVSNTVETHAWQERQNICSSLLQMLGYFSIDNMEPNGLSLIVKLRMMASSLIRYAMSDKEDELARAQSYLNHFLEIMVKLEVHRGKDAEQEGWDLLKS